MYYYHVGPIDHWYGAMTDEDLWNSLANRENQIPAGKLLVFARQVMRAAWKMAEIAEGRFREIGWEGDIVEARFWAIPHPDCCDMRLGYIVKQYNNGSTFVASPIALDYLQSQVLGSDYWCHHDEG